MYLQYFGLREPPFSIAPNPRYLFMSERHREALAHLVYGLQGAGGFVVLTGEVGAGKTTLARRFLEEIPANCRVAYLINPNVTTAELLQSICDEFGIPVTSSSRRDDEAPSNKSRVDAINTFLLSEYAEGRSCVVIVDEAQNLSPEVMEQLRLLTNLETNERKLLQIILIGQPELRELLARHDLRQVDQRVVARYHLASLDVQDTEHYLSHRIGIAGGQVELFAPNAATAVYARTEGIPRRINVLADRALLGTYAQGLPQVTDAIVNKAAAEVFQLDVGTGNKPHKQPASIAHGLIKPALWIASLAAVGALTYALTNANSLNSAKSTHTEAASPAVQSAPASSSSLPASAAAQNSTNINTDTRNSSPIIANNNNSKQSNTNDSISISQSPDTPNLSKLLSAIAADPVQREAPARALLSLWRTALPTGLMREPLTQGLCDVAQAARLACYSSRASLQELRENNHPALITLAEDGVYALALIDKVNDKSANLVLGNSRLEMSLVELLPRWQGDFTLLWSPLSGGPNQTPVNNLSFGTQGPAVADMLTRMASIAPLSKELAALATAPAPRYDSRVQAAVRSFQQTQGLLTDGGAGPQTLVRINALASREQPRLSAVSSSSARP